MGTTKDNVRILIHLSNQEYKRLCDLLAKNNLNQGYYATEFGAKIMIIDFTDEEYKKFLLLHRENEKKKKENKVGSNVIFYKLYIEKGE